MIYAPELETACDLALRAGAILLGHYSRTAEVEWKEGGSPVTQADKDVNAFLIRELRNRFPHDSILSEEQARDAAAVMAPRIWILDPMDGTREFIDHNGEFSVMIGLAVDGHPAVGAVYQPTEDKLYSAAVGGGASLTQHGKQTRLTVSPVSDPARMTVAFSRSHQSPIVEAVCTYIGVTRFVRSGSIGLKVGLICERRAHLYLHTGSHISQWDTCAADIILREAGGRMTDKYGVQLRYGGEESRLLDGVAASTGTIHSLIVEAAARG